MKIKKITVLYNVASEIAKGNPEERLTELDNENSANDVFKALVELGYEVNKFQLNNSTFPLLKTIKADLIFNLLEGFDDLPISFSSITSYIESLHIPMTGTTGFSGILTTDKARAKEVMVRNKIPTPSFQLFFSSEDSLKYNLRYPLITKPNMADCSVGITQDSVVKNLSDLKERVDYIKEKYADATLVEDFITGREIELFGVNLGKSNFFLPILEAIFLPDKGRQWDICDFTHKWVKSYCDEVVPAKLPEGVSEQVFEIGNKCVKAFDLKGYFRIDIRLSKDNIPFVVEVNVNPGIDEPVLHSKLLAKGVTYNELIKMVVDAAIYEHEKKLVTSGSFSNKSNLLKSNS